MAATVSPSEYAPMHAPYVARVQGADIVDTLQRQRELIAAVGAAVPADREEYRYAPGKWSIREVIGHLADGERIFGYRALCVARGEQQSLPGFDENAYAAASTAGRRPLRDLVDELLALRVANVAMFAGFDEEAWSRAGTANQFPVTPRGMAFVIAGHFLHHLDGLRERYGVAVAGPSAAEEVAAPPVGA